MVKRKLLYSDIFEFNRKLFKIVSDEYGYTDIGWKIFREHYKDPDGYPINENGFKSIGDIECTVDALISIIRMYEHEGFNESSEESYGVYREVPIFFFPRENGGINTSRFTVFGDRIDHTLFDIKRYCDGYRDCKLINAFEQKNTKAWFEAFEYDYEKIIEWLDIKDIFVEFFDDDYHVIDLENGGYIENYLDFYTRSWSDKYYKNVIQKISDFRNSIK